MDKEQRLKEITEWMLHVEERAEQAEQRILQEAREKAKVENMRILETEWADYKKVWQRMLNEGKTTREALDFLNFSHKEAYPINKKEK